MLKIGELKMIIIFEDWEGNMFFELAELGYKSKGRRPLLNCKKGRYLEGYDS